MMGTAGLRLLSNVWRPQCRTAAPTISHFTLVRWAAPWSRRGSQSSAKKHSKTSTARNAARAVVEVDGAPWCAYDEYENLASLPKDKTKIVMVDGEGKVVKALAHPRDGLWDAQAVEDMIARNERLPRAGKWRKKTQAIQNAQRRESESTADTDPKLDGFQTRNLAQESTMPKAPLNVKSADGYRLAKERSINEGFDSNTTKPSIEHSLSSEKVDYRRPVNEKPAHIIQRLMDKNKAISRENNSNPTKVKQPYYSEQDDEGGNSNPPAHSGRQDGGLGRPATKELPTDNMFAKLAAARQTAKRDRFKISERVLEGGSASEQRFERLKPEWSLPSRQDVPPTERWRLKVAKKRIRRQAEEAGLQTGIIDLQPPPRPDSRSVLRQGKKKERNPNKPFGKTAHAKLDLKKLGRLDENENLNFTIYPWKPMLQSHRSRIHHVKFSGFEHKTALQPRLFYERIVTWPYIIEREWLTGQQTIYRYEARLRPLFFSDWHIPEMWFQGHGKNQKDADQAAFIQMLSKLHKNFDPNTKLDDFLPGQKYGIPYNPDVPIEKNKDMPHLVGRSIWLMQSLDTQLEFLEKVEFEVQRLSDIGKRDEIDAWNEFMQFNLVHAVKHTRHESKAKEYEKPVEDVSADPVAELERQATSVHPVVAK
ncbi:hypothetical protein V1506DRAFT_513069 [Lipomyces tetrasporus]